jgi:hypothetical protein
MQTNLLKPKIISVEALTANQAKVVMEPFERGYGHTLGNALRPCTFVLDGWSMLQAEVATCRCSS